MQETVEGFRERPVFHDRLQLVTHNGRPGREPKVQRHVEELRRGQDREDGQVIDIDLPRLSVWGRDAHLLHRDGVIDGLFGRFPTRRVHSPRQAEGDETPVRPIDHDRVRHPLPFGRSTVVPLERDHRLVPAPLHPGPELRGKSRQNPAQPHFVPAGSAVVVGNLGPIAACSCRVRSL